MAAKRSPLATVRGSLLAGNGVVVDGKHLGFLTVHVIWSQLSRLWLSNRLVHDSQTEWWLNSKL